MRRAAAGLVAAAMSGAACAGAPRVGPAAGLGGEACIVVPAPRATGSGAAAEARPVVVGLPGPVGAAHAPAARTAADRLVFAQLYQTLVGATCDGRIEPLLAASWTAESGGRRWVFSLRTDARDWTGRVVTARDVASSLLAARTALEAGSAPDAPRIRSVIVEDARTLAVDLDRPAGIAFFASPELAVGQPAGAPEWPRGTGLFRPVADGPAAPAAGAVRLVAVNDGRQIELRPARDDLRDALDGGVDVLVTSDPAAITYARSTDAFDTAPLPWSRTYLLVVPRARAVRPADPDDGPPGVLNPAPEPALAALARDATRFAARPADALADLDVCLSAGTGAASPAAATRASEPRVIFPAGDEAARQLAERLVALSLDPTQPEGSWLPAAAPELTGDTRATAAGMEPRAFADALRTGRDAAYVLALDRNAVALDACTAARDLITRAPWLEDGAAALVPLVDTRETLLVRRGIGGISVDGHGTLLLDRIRRSDGASP